MCSTEQFSASGSQLPTGTPDRIPSQQPSQQVAVTKPKLSSEAPAGLQVAAFAQASPLTMPTRRQAAVAPVYQAASQPQLAPIFKQAAVAAAASIAATAAAPRIAPFGGKKLRDHAAGTGSNVGTDRGGAGVAKTCRACLQFEHKTVHRTAAHNTDCPYCATCAGKTTKALKKENGVVHNCPYK